MRSPFWRPSVLPIFCLPARCSSTHPREVFHLKRLWGKAFPGFLLLTMLPNGVCAQCTVKPNHPKHQSLEQRRVYCRAVPEQVSHAPPPPQTLSSLKGFSKAVLKARWESGGPGYVIRSCTDLWLSDVEITGQLAPLTLRDQNIWGLPDHNHQVVTFCHLVMALVSEKQLRR